MFSLITWENTGNILIFQTKLNAPHSGDIELTTGFTPNTNCEKYYRNSSKTCLWMVLLGPVTRKRIVRLFVMRGNITVDNPARLFLRLMFRCSCMKSRKPTQRKIKELVAFLPLLYKPDISPVKKWHGGDKDADGVITMPWPEYEPVVMEFIKVAEYECWTDYDYLSESSRQILDNENVIKTADLDQIKTALTFCVRGERFCTGHWNSVIENGYVRRLLQRLAELGLNGEKS